MPTIRFGDQGQEEGSSGRPNAANLEFQRVSSNLALSQQIGQYIAGEIQTQFKDEDLAGQLKGIDPRAVTVSASWG